MQYILRRQPGPDNNTVQIIGSDEYSFGMMAQGISGFHIYNTSVHEYIREKLSEGKLIYTSKNLQNPLLIEHLMIVDPVKDELLGTEEEQKLRIVKYTTMLRIQEKISACNNLFSMFKITVFIGNLLNIFETVKTLITEENKNEVFIQALVDDNNDDVMAQLTRHEHLKKTAQKFVDVAELYVLYDQRIEECFSVEECIQIEKEFEQDLAKVQYTA